jgi:hypothetical protein
MSVELGIREGHDGFGGRLDRDIRLWEFPSSDFIANTFISRSS